jgi:hypothetical protein
MLRRRPAPGPPTAPAPAAIPAPRQRVAAPEGARHLVMVVLDSLRYDTWLAASTHEKVFEVPFVEGLVP